MRYGIDRFGNRWDWDTEDSDLGMMVKAIDGGSCFCPATAIEKAYGPLTWHDEPEQDNYAGGTEREWDAVSKPIGKIAPRTKSEFVRRYQQGEFGNRLQNWDDRQSLLASGFSGSVGIRNRVAGGRFYYGVKVADLRDEWGYPEPESQMYFSEMAPDERLVLQGEVSVGERGLMLVYATEPGVSMRVALSQRAPLHAYGTAAVMTMQWAMDPSSYDDVRGMLDSYPGAVIEFSSYNVNCGILPHRNTIVWEVRSY